MRADEALGVPGARAAGGPCAPVMRRRRSPHPTHILPCPAASPPTASNCPPHHALAFAHRAAALLPIARTLSTPRAIAGGMSGVHSQPAEAAIRHSGSGLWPPALCGGYGVGEPPQRRRDVCDSHPIPACLPRTRKRVLQQAAPLALPTFGKQHGSGLGGPGAYAVGREP